MLAYVIVGTDDLDRATRFYDAALTPLGLVRTENETGYAGYNPKDSPA